MHALYMHARLYIGYMCMLSVVSRHYFCARFVDKKTGPVRKIRQTDGKLDKRVTRRDKRLDMGGVGPGTSAGDGEETKPEECRQQST